MYMSRLLDDLCKLSDNETSESMYMSRSLDYSYKLSDNERSESNMSGSLDDSYPVS